MNGSPTHVLVVGIDEAGYGPLLGPLVVSSVAFQAPAESVDADWWGLLRDAVAAKPRTRSARLVVTDSKELSRRDDGLRWLERAALTFLSLPDAYGAPRSFPPAFRGLVGQLDREVLNAVAEYPWYREADFALPAETTAHDIYTQRAALHGALAAAGMAFVGARCEILLEGHFNRLVRATRNKSVVLLGRTIRLIQRAAQTYAPREMHVYVDKQGGREAYGRPLMTAFENAEFAIREETDVRSVYRLCRPDSTWEITFAQGGEKHHLATALASIFSKYLRELFMRAFNVFWMRHIPGVTPTAGYYADGQRFLRDIEPAIRSVGIDRAILVREK